MTKIDLNASNAFLLPLLNREEDSAVSFTLHCPDPLTSEQHEAIKDAMEALAKRFVQDGTLLSACIDIR